MADQHALIQEALTKKTWAVVGASDNETKFGNIIYRDLKQQGLNVYGVNPAITELYGDPIYPTLADLPEKPDVVDVVVPRWVGRRIATETSEQGIEYFWLQPGAEGDELIQYAESLGLKVIHHACVMEELRKQKSRTEQSARDPERRHNP